MDFELSSNSGNIMLPTLLAISQRLPAGLVGKFRITSMVVDPQQISGTSSTSGSTVSFDLNMAVSGNHFQQADMQKPLRVRFSNAMGSDGQWYRVTTAGIIPASQVLVGTTSTPDIGLLVIGTINSDINTTNSTVSTVHIRIAWTDVGEIQ